MGQPSVDLVTPCTLVLYRCGCAEVMVDALVDFSDERGYMPLVRIETVENGGEEQDHSRNFDYKCGQLIGFFNAFPAYCDFMAHYGLLERQRAA